jgi:di- and tripeptidase
LQYSIDPRQWYNLKERDSKTTDPSTHPHFREDRFFDSKGPGGVRTPRREYADSVSSGFSTKDLEIDRRYIQPFAHFGYVYCMLLLRGIVTEDTDEETLVSGGGDGSIKLWSLIPEKAGQIREKFELRLGQGEDNSVLSFALDGSFLISGRLRGEVNIWDLETRQLVRTINSSVADVLALSVGGGCLFVSGSNGTVEVS